MGCAAIDRVDVLKVATPLPSSVPVPRLLLPSLNCTVPVAITPDTLPLTVAANVTPWPNTRGLPLDVTLVLVLALLTLWLRLLDVLPLKSMSPWYTTLRL